MLRICHIVICILLYIYNYYCRARTCYGVSATLFDVCRTLLLTLIRPFFAHRALEGARLRVRRHGSRLGRLLSVRRRFVDGVLGHRSAVAVAGRGSGRRRPRGRHATAAAAAAGLAQLIWFK